MNKQTQYRQIDYLRLFRLCKNLGFVNRKRKMPSEYDVDYSDANGARSAGKRLLGTMIKNLFSDFMINSDYGSYFLSVPSDIRLMLVFLRSKERSYFSAVGEKGIEALRKFTELSQLSGGHVIFNIPYEIRISMISQSRDSIYNIAKASGAVDKPREDFYRCAKACIEFRKVWDENIPFLSSFVDEEKKRERERNEAIRREREEELKLKRERSEQERAETVARERALRELEIKAEDERQKRIENAQSVFNNALQQFKGLKKMRAEDCNLTITFEGGNDANISITEPDGIIKQKTVSIDDIILNLASAYRFSSGLVPRGTRFFSGTSEDYLIGIETEAKVRRMRSVGNEVNNLMIPFPKCLFVFLIRKQTIIKTWLFSLKNALEKENDIVYNFPFGNTYIEGHVCWGEAKLPKINNPMELIGVINVFLDSGFNGDLVEDYSFMAPENYEEGERRVECFWSLLKYLEGKDKFPENMLVENNTLLNTMKLGVYE